MTGEGHRTLLGAWRRNDILRARVLAHGQTDNVPALDHQAGPQWLNRHERGGTKDIGQIPPDLQAYFGPGSIPLGDVTPHGHE